MRERAPSKAEDNAAYGRLRFPAMPEASAARRNRWYRVKWPDQRNLSPAWAEKYFDNHTEAFDYFERRRAEHPTGRVHGPCNRTRSPLPGPSAWTPKKPIDNRLTGPQPPVL